MIKNDVYFNEIQLWRSETAILTAQQEQFKYYG